MPNRFATVLGTVVVSLVSLLAAFFVTFNMVFSDIFGLRERLWSYAFAATAFFILGLFCGVIGPLHVRRWTGILVAPSVAILVLYTFSEPQNVLIHLGFALLVPAAAYAGVHAGAGLRSSKPTGPRR